MGLFTERDEYDDFKVKPNNMWIAEVTWKDNSRYYFGPFTEYDSGIKVWSAEFSHKYGSMVYSIDYHKLENPSQ